MTMPLEDVKAITLRFFLGNPSSGLVNDVKSSTSC